MRPVGDLPRTPWWTVVAGASAPVLLVGGWTIGDALQPARYSPIHDSISALAAHGATDRWVMNGALIGVGLCYALVAVGLGPARKGGRVVLAGGGVATLLVAAFPLPVHGSAPAHAIAATVAFVALGSWPVLASRSPAAATLLTRTSSWMATAVLLGLLAWFALDLHGGERGLAERVVASAQATWPLLVVLDVRLAHGRFGDRSIAPDHVKARAAPGG